MTVSARQESWRLVTPDGDTAIDLQPLQRLWTEAQYLRLTDGRRRLIEFTQLVDLNYLLWSALRHADRESFAKLVDCKLSRKSMNVAQRARWLAAGFVLSPEGRSETVRAFTEKSERRLWTPAKSYPNMNSRGS